MEEKNRIDYGKIFHEIMKKKKLYLKTLPVAFILACIIIFPQPRYYVSDVKLAPEGMEEMDAGSLSSIASSFGINIGGGANDAIYPMLYPELFESPEFIVKLLNIQVEYTREDEPTIKTDYYTYLRDYQQKNWLTYPFKYAVKWVKGLFSSKKGGRAASAKELDPFCMTRDDLELAEKVGDLISCSIDKKTNVTAISVTDQNNLVAAQMADSVRVLLQGYITNLRTAKAKQNVAHYQHLVDSVKTEYDKSALLHAQFADEHKNTISQAVQLQLDNLETRKDLDKETYTTLISQLTLSKTKLQEKMPVFTVLKSATVAAKPAGPKRMFFVAAMLVLAFIGTTCYILKEIIKEAI